MMLVTVVTFFFICLLPFRALIVWIILAPHEEVMSLGNEGYYSLLYFCRIMFYLNSAINPILYNLMSSKFRNGFLKLCGIKKNCFRKHTRALLRTSTFNTSSLTAITSSSLHRPSMSDVNSQGKDRKKSRDFNRRNSCSKSLLLYGDSNSNSKSPRLKGYLAKVNCDKRKSDKDKCHMKILQINRRKSFSDFLLAEENFLLVVNHSRSMDSILKENSYLATRKINRKNFNTSRKASNFRNEELLRLKKNSTNRRISDPVKLTKTCEKISNGIFQTDKDQILKKKNMNSVKRNKSNELKESFV